MTPYEAQLASLESSGGQRMYNALGSGATGKYQFMPKTWAGLVTQYPGLLTMDGITDNAPGGQQDVALRLFNDSNNRVLKQALGRDPLQWETYAAHRFGARGAQWLFNADDGAPSSQIFPADWIKKNPDIADKTAGEVKQLFQGRFGETTPIEVAAPKPAMPPQPTVPDQPPVQETKTMPTGLLDTSTPAGADTSAGVTGGLLGGGGDWTTALAAGLMSLGDGLRGGSGAAGMQLIQHMQQQQGQQVLAAAAKKLQGPKPDYDGAFALMMSNPTTAKIGMEMFPTMAKQRQQQQVMSALGFTQPSGGQQQPSAPSLPTPSMPSASAPIASPPMGGASAAPAPAPQQATQPRPPMAQGAQPRPPMAQGGALNLTPQQLALAEISGMNLLPIQKYSIEGASRERGKDWYNPQTGRWEYLVAPDKGQTFDAAGNIVNAPGAVDAAAASKRALTTAEKTAASDVDLAPAPDSPGVPPTMNRKTAEAYSGTAGTNAANLPVRVPEYAKGLRDDFASNPIVKNRNEAVTAYRSIEDAAKRDTLPSDLNMVYALAKLFDPGSVVREGEMIMVNRSQALPEQLIGAINSVNGGNKLQNREALLAEARGRIAQHEEQYQNFANWMGGVATRVGVEPRDVIQDVPVKIERGASAPGDTGNPAPQPGPKADTAPPPGKYKIGKNGEFIPLGD